MRIFIYLIIITLISGCANSDSKTSQKNTKAKINNDTLVNDSITTAANIKTDNVSQISINEVAECTAIENSINRLACYDNLAKSLGLTKTSKTTSGDLGKGEWVTNVTTNPIDDSKTVVLSLISESGQSTYGMPTSLSLRCKSNTTEAYIYWNDYLGSEADVTTRIGEGRAQTRKWSISTDNEATFFPGSDITFIKNLMQVNKFVAQVTPYNESPVTLVFNIEGLSKAIKPLRETCNW